ncbi:MAG: sulfite exporter TauE/SafE family protein [Cytophagaceae bacterium]|nr:sulfite exporter TauE/SafE family protein [Gemmatimonadaceae bacterium]
MEPVSHGVLGLALAVAVGFILGLLGGGGSILALPIFLYVFKVPTKSAVAMSLAVVGMSAAVGFLSHWRQGNVNLRVALPFGLLAMVGAFGTAKVAHGVPANVQLTLFVAFALAAAVFMLRDSLRPALRETAPTGPPPRFSVVLGMQAVAVGVLTALIGAGGGFVIVPALVLLAKVPVRSAVGSSLLIIAMNGLSGFVGYIGVVPIDWALVGEFTGLAAVGAIAGTMVAPRVPTRRIKQGFAVTIILLGALVVARRVGLLG